MKKKKDIIDGKLGESHAEFEATKADIWSQNTIFSSPSSHYFPQPIQTTL